MKCTVKAAITSVVKKVSRMDNIYHEINLIETTKSKIEGNEPLVTEWNKLYFPHDIPLDVKTNLLKGEQELVIKFYPVKRTVGEQVFDNISCHVESIKGVNDIE